MNIRLQPYLFLLIAFSAHLGAIVNRVGQPVNNQ